MGICVKKFILPGCLNWVELGLRPGVFSGQALPMKSDRYLSTSEGEARECGEVRRYI